MRASDELLLSGTDEHVPSLTRELFHLHEIESRLRYVQAQTHESGVFNAVTEALVYLDEIRKKLIND